MLVNFLYRHQQVTSALSLSKNKHVDVSNAEIELLEAARQTLQPFYEATVELSTERASSVSKIKPLVHLLIVFAAEDHTLFGASLHQQPVSRFANIENTQHLQIATLLDPRLKKVDFQALQQPQKQLMN